MGPQSSSLKAALNPKSGSRVRSGLKEGLARRREAPLRRFLPYKAFRAVTGFPECGNKSKKARLPPSPTVHDPMVQHPMAHGPTVLRSHGLRSVRKSPGPMVPSAALSHKPAP